MILTNTYIPWDWMHKSIYVVISNMEAFNAELCETYFFNTCLVYHHITWPPFRIKFDGLVGFQQLWPISPASNKHFAELKLLHRNNPRLAYRISHLFLILKSRKFCCLFLILQNALRTDNHRSSYVDCIFFSLQNIWSMCKLPSEVQVLVSTENFTWLCTDQTRTQSWNN